MPKICTLSECPCRRTSFNFVSCFEPFLSKFPNDFTNKCWWIQPDEITGLAINYQNVDELHQIGAFPKLYTLSLSRNKLTHIEEGVFQSNEGLRFLAIAENDLTSIESGAFDPLINANAIHLSDNPNLKNITTQ